jgi:hypothetical protein
MRKSMSMHHPGYNKTLRGNKKGVKGTGGNKRGKRVIHKSQGIAMKPRGKSMMAQSRIDRMEKMDPAV